MNRKERRKAARKGFDHKGSKKGFHKGSFGSFGVSIMAGNIVKRSRLAPPAG